MAIFRNEKKDKKMRKFCQSIDIEFIVFIEFFLYIFRAGLQKPTAVLENLVGKFHAALAPPCFEM